MPRLHFPLFINHRDLMRYWCLKLLKSGDTVLDATSGNGHDTLFLARAVLTENSGRVYAMDCQQQALLQTQHRLAAVLPPSALSRVTLLHADHAAVADKLQGCSLKLGVYNLGYLPGSDKSVITHAESTVASLNGLLPLIVPGGAISITCYLGHPGGQEEYHAVHTWASQLPPTWNVCSCSWLNKPLAPAWLFLQLSDNS